MGIKIKDAQLTEQLKLEDKFPISNGSNKAVTANIQQVKQLITEGLVIQETDPIFSASAASGITSDNIRDWNNKVDKISGKQLSTEDFTTALKNKLDSLSNYDDTQLENAINTLRNDFDELVSGDTTTAINTFNEIIAFLDGISDTEDLSSIIASIEQQIAAKQDKITDLETIKQGAAKGATALQSYTEKYTGTITGITMNGSSKGTSGVIDLGTVITAHQDISGKVDSSSLAKVATSGSYNDLNDKPTIPDSLSDLSADSTHRTVTDTEKATWNAKSNFSGSYTDLTNKPTIPSAVTESTVSGWGFTKNTGTYSKPSVGIPKSDLESAVQTSLGKADTALQTHQDISGKQDNLISGENIKTVNNQSILGQGDLVIPIPSVEEITPKNEAYEGDSSITSWVSINGKSNTMYIITSPIDYLDISFIDTGIGFTVKFITKDTCTIDCYPDIMWANGTIPIIEPNTEYELSLSRSCQGLTNAVLLSFKTAII